MARTFATAMRRTSRLMRQRKIPRSTRLMQKAMTKFMVKSATVVLKPKAAKARKAVVSKVGHTQESALRQSRMPGTMGRPAALELSPRIPKGAHYLARAHRCAAGSRDYKLYLPACHPNRLKGLILMLHGCKQTPNDFAVGTHMNALAEKHGLVLAYPAQSGGDNAAGCWNWFKPGNQLRGAGEPAILVSLTQQLMKEFGLGRNAVFVAGLSAGGAMAAILADVYPDVFSAAGIHSGLARGAAHDVISAMSAMRSGGQSQGISPVVATKAKPVRRIVFHGENDSTVHPSNAEMIVTAAMDGDTQAPKVHKRSVHGRVYSRSNFAGSDGVVLVELWMIEGAGHAWSGGRTSGSFTDRKGPDASAQMVRFFLT